MTRLEDWRAKRLADARVARWMLAEWPKGIPRLKVETLGARLSELRRHRNEKWWLKRRVLLRLLAADVLYADVEDLIVPSLLEPESIAFAEFSRLPPLAPGQEPCRVSRSGWLLDEVMMGRSLLPALAAAVASPERRECPAKSAGSKPASRAQRLTIRATLWSVSLVERIPSNS